MLNVDNSNKNVFLVGPFIGELSWEFYRFAPYIINLKKSNPLSKFVVLTRPSRFDLYGQYANILVTLNLPKDLENSKISGFSVEEFEVESYYRLLISSFLKKYSVKFKNKNIIQIYPEIVSYFSKLKWQFPRNQMDYDFKPRRPNQELIKKYIIDQRCIFIDSKFDNNISKILQQYQYEILPIFIDDFSNLILQSEDASVTFLGCLIEALKKCIFVVSDFSSYITHLSLLVGTPVLTNDTVSQDYIHTLNPKNTPVLFCDNIERGIKEWLDTYNENNF